MIIFWLVCITELALVYYCSKTSVGVGPDSTVYFGAVKSLLRGRGLLMPVIDIPLIHFPPLYPLLLAVSSPLRLTVVDWARGLNLIFVPANLTLALLIARRLDPRWYLLPVLLIASSRSFLEIHLMAWSESSYIFLSFAGILCLFLHLEKPRVWMVCLAGLFCGLAWLDRYIGLALVLALGAGLFFYSGKKRLDLALFGSFAGLPTLGWLVYNLVIGGRAIDRRINLFPILPVEAGIVIGLLICGLAAHRYLRSRPSARLLDLLALYLFFYAAVLGVTVCLLDPDTLVLDFRILSPVFFGGYLLLAGFIAAYTRRRRLFLAVLVCICLLQGMYVATFTRSVSASGLSEASGEWRWEEIYIPAHDWR